MYVQGHIGIVYRIERCEWACIDNINYYCYKSACKS